MAHSGSKSNIKILSRDITLTPTAEGIPVYSVPLQSTATLNIVIPLSKSGDTLAGRGDESDDSDAELDVENLERNAGALHESSFSCITWDLPNGEDAREENACVIIMNDVDVVAMIKATCQSTKGTRSRLVWDLLVDIAKNFTRRLKRMKDMQLPKICAQHMDTLPLSDGKQTKVHLDEVSRKQKEHVALTDVAYRFQSSEVFLGTYVHEAMETAKNYSIGKAGVVVVLSLKSKYATADAFSEQLCKHVALNHPTSLGKISETDIKKINKRGTMKILHLQKDQLLLQNFASDPTIIVAEAARRSFVKINDFLLFK